MFARREPPEGFIFPACEVCNGGYRLEDQIASFVAAFAGSDDPDMYTRFQKLLEGLRNNQPEHLPDAHISANDKRRILAELGVAKPPSTTFADVPLVGVPVAVKAIVEKWLRKQFLAIYYRECNAIFPRSGLVSSLMIFNADMMRKTDPVVLPKLRNATRTNLRGQDKSREFSYAWEFDESRGVFATIAIFQRGFVGVMAGVFDITGIDYDNRLPWYDLSGSLVVPGADPEGAAVG
jgi:hypothetical protein